LTLWKPPDDNIRQSPSGFEIDGSLLDHGILHQLSPIQGQQTQTGGTPSSSHHTKQDAAKDSG